MHKKYIKLSLSHPLNDTWYITSQVSVTIICLQAELLALRQTPTLEDQGAVLSGPSPTDQSGSVEPVRSKNSRRIALWVARALKPPSHNKAQPFYCQKLFGYFNKDLQTKNNCWNNYCSPGGDRKASKYTYVQSFECTRLV